MAVDEFAAIIGGSVAAAAVLIIIIVVIICLLCAKRRRKKTREKRTLHTSPNHSQPSSISQGPPLDTRFPKVTTNGSWTNFPGYAYSPQRNAYDYYKSPGAKHHYLMQPPEISRATSETGLHLPPRGQASAGYYTRGSPPRIYHSQQLRPVYETVVVDSRNGSVLDVYEAEEGSRTKLVTGAEKAGGHYYRADKRPLSSHNGAFYDSSKVLNHSQAFGGAGHRPHSAGSGSKEKVQVHKQMDSKISESAFENRAFSQSMEKVHQGKIHQEKAQQERTHQEKIQQERIHQEKIVASATDSMKMKLLTENRTDDQKTVVHAKVPSVQAVEKKSSPASSPEPNGTSTQQYTTEAGLYAVPHKKPDTVPHKKPVTVPEKDPVNLRSENDNPILFCMQKMDLDREAGGAPTQIVDPVTDIAETSEPLLISIGGGKTSLVQNPIYQEALENSDSVRTGAKDLTRDRPDSPSSGSEVDDPDSGVQSVGDAGDVLTNDLPAGSAPGKDSENQVELSSVVRRKWSIDTDDRAGKHISVMAEAFGFLDSYLSDEEGDDIHSPPKSPVLGSDRGELY